MSTFYCVKTGKEAKDGQVMVVSYDTIKPTATKTISWIQCIEWREGRCFDCKTEKREGASEQEIYS